MMFLTIGSVVTPQNINKKISRINVLISTATEHVNKHVLKFQFF